MSGISSPDATVLAVCALSLFVAIYQGRTLFTRRQLIELVGYAGSTSLLGVYMLMLTDRIDGHGALFNLGMLVGCALLGLNMAAHRAWPGVVTQAVFCFVAALALVHIFY